MSISCGSKAVNLSAFVTYHCSAWNYNFGFKFQKVHLSTKNFMWKWTRVGSNWYSFLFSSNGERCVKTFRVQGRSPGLFSGFGGDCGMPYLCWCWGPEFTHASLNLDWLAPDFPLNHHLITFSVYSGYRHPSLLHRVHPCWGDPRRSHGQCLSRSTAICSHFSIKALRSAQLSL